MQLPYIYLPNNDWDTFAEHIAKINQNIICSSQKNSCKFDLPCNLVQSANWTISFDIFDDLNRGTFQIPNLPKFLLTGD